MTDGGGCIECHDPHGSENDQLLKQPKDRLCQSCHMTPPTHNTAHGGTYAGVDCLSCHSEIHGAISGRKLLSENLGAKFGQSCWCHGVN
jgi:predicted CXXCH cytochrome family protein